MKKIKQGENEARIILESIGVRFENNYFDDNSILSMPDLKYQDGRGLEITHTKHNHNLVLAISKYDEIKPGEENSDWIQRHLDTEIKCSEALDRINNFDYQCDDKGRFSSEAEKQYKKDLKLLKEHMGYDPTRQNIYEQFSEFNCDRPIISFSIENIIREIVEDKGQKYPTGEVDLFIFATTEEFNLMKELVDQREWNGVSIDFINKIIYSPFNTIFVCEWDFERQEYNTKNPKMIRFCKEKDSLGIRWFNFNNNRCLKESIE